GRDVDRRRRVVVGASDFVEQDVDLPGPPEHAASEPASEGAPRSSSRGLSTVPDGAPLIISRSLLRTGASFAQAAEVLRALRPAEAPSCPALECAPIAASFEAHRERARALSAALGRPLAARLVALGPPADHRA